MVNHTLLTAAASFFVAASATAQTITATIDAGKRGAPIQPLVYGMFVEHIGGLLEQGFRAELLDDRKFFYAVGDAGATGGRGGRGGPRRVWRAVGGDAAVRMDSANAYASRHAPRITVASAEAHGISQ